MGRKWKRSRASGSDGDVCCEYPACSRAGEACVNVNARRRQTGATRAQTVEFLRTELMTAGGRVRVDGRTAEQMRPLKITPDFISTAEGSVLIELGNTRVICTATVDDGVP